MNEILNKVRDFNRERDWEQFHTPENLAKSISIEAAELLECFQWNNDYDIERVSDEISDIILYCLMFSDKVGLNLKEEILKKIEKNRDKYPIDKSKGKSIKYDMFEE